MANEGNLINVFDTKVNSTKTRVFSVRGQRERPSFRGGIRANWFTAVGTGLLLVAEVRQFGQACMPSHSLHGGAAVRGGGEDMAVL